MTDLGRRLSRLAKIYGAACRTCISWDQTRVEIVVPGDDDQAPANVASLPLEGLARCPSCGRPRPLRTQVVQIVAPDFDAEDPEVLG